ncbi:MAG: sodium:calcium antiporter [Planctomycetota bacterium]|jgi:cation:H+ antiporter
MRRLAALPIAATLLLASSAEAAESALSDALWPDLLPGPWNAWLRLLVAAAAVIFAGIKLSRYGDMLSVRLRLGQAVVGMIFVAFATSLPEIVTCVGAVAVQKQPGLAVGNGFGSIAFNLAIIFVVDLMAGEKSLFHYVAKKSARPGWLSLLLITVFGVSLFAEAALPRPIEFLRIGAGSFLVLVSYVAGMWWLSRRARAEALAAEEGGEKEDGAGADEAVLSSTGIFVRYGAVALVILWAGLNLSAAGDSISDHYGLGKTFVGVMFLAVATSLPELTVAVSAARSGLYEMILGNIFGANMFNVVVIAVSDIFYAESIARATIYDGEESLPGVISVGFAAVITCVAVFGVLRKVRARIWRATLPSIAILLLYLGMAWWLYSLK